MKSLPITNPMSDADYEREIEKMSVQMRMILDEMNRSQTRIDELSNQTRLRIEAMNKALDAMAAR